MNFIKKSINEELGKLKGMTGKEKADYIWEYYHIHFFVILFILLFVWAVLDATVIHPTKPTYLGLGIYGPYVETGTLTEIEQDLTVLMMTDEEMAESSVYVTNFFMGDEQDYYARANRDKFVAMCSAQELDVIVSPKEQFIEFARNDYLVDLSLVDGIDYPTEDMLYSAVEGDSENPGTEYPFGIPLAGTKFLDRGYLASNMQELYIGVIINTKRPEQAIEAIGLVIKE